ASEGYRRWAKSDEQSGPNVVSKLSVVLNLIVREARRALRGCAKLLARFDPKPYIMYGRATATPLFSAREKNGTVHHVRFALGLLWVCFGLVAGVGIEPTLTLR